MDCGRENGHLRLLSRGDGVPDRSGCNPRCNSVTCDELADLVLTRLAALQADWDRSQDRKAMRRGLLALLQVLEEP